MDNKSKNNENRSMYIYTALIFVVALLLIIIAFFGQTNVSNNRKTIDTVTETTTELTTEPATELPTETQTEAATPTPEPENDDYAKLSNAFNALNTENETLKGKLTVYELLLSANKAVSDGDTAAAETALASVNPDELTEEQKILYDEIISIINE